MMDADTLAPDGALVALRQRMADVYGVAAVSVLPVRGTLHGVALVMRRVVLAGSKDVVAPDAADFAQLTKIAGLALVTQPDRQTGAIFTSSPSREDGRALTPGEARAGAAEAGDALFVVDESLVELSDAPSLAAFAESASNLVVLRDLGGAYGFPDEPCAALIANPALIASFEQVLEPQALSPAAIRAARAALDPSRMAAHARRFAAVRAEKARVLAALTASPSVAEARATDGPFVFITPRVGDAVRADLRRLAVAGAWRDASCFRLDVGATADNERALAAFGVWSAAAGPRRSEVTRETLETSIVAAVDLDAQGGSEIDTGVGFFDHMLAQVAAHGGFSLSLQCRGDLEVDAHHTIEDCALALGQALKEALGAKRGIARYGFVLPMDEAEAKVSIDLGGRPYLVFEGAFTAPLIGAYPTEMTEHVFRSLAQSMGAAIHLSVTGENDHHKTEACFKAFGRALRQAVRIEGDVTPSTKGVIT
jgi:histidinol-phosphate aminotransferase/imidazoleglycerol-phosphate dehydratase/histidinol-phosphatase